MRQYLNTALIILAFASCAQGQFTEIWTNGDLFAVNEMASQCYSASVERCTAVGVTPNTPSFWDYLLGKNRAKLVSVKANISACRPYFVNPSANVISELTARDTATWSNNIHFLSDCGLPTNALDETPWFSSQYASVTGGWVHCWVMLTNQVVSENAGYYTPRTTNLLNGTHLWLGGSQSVSTNWANQKSEAEAYWQYSEDLAFNVVPYRFTGGRKIDEYDTLAFGVNQYFPLGYNLPPSSIGKSAKVYHKAEADVYGWYPFIAATTNIMTFDAQGTGATNGWWYVGEISSRTNDYDAGLDVVPRGDSTNDPGFPPNWCDDPAPYGIGAYTTMGFGTDGQRIILNWTATTNGFKYR